MEYGTLIIGSLRQRTLDRRGWHRRLLRERPPRRGRRQERRAIALRLAFSL